MAGMAAATRLPGQQAPRDPRPNPYTNLIAPSLPPMRVPPSPVAGLPALPPLPSRSAPSTKRRKLNVASASPGIRYALLHHKVLLG
jgi:hypothetical protein